MNSERDLCDEITELAKKNKFSVYPEYENYDLVLSKGHFIFAVQTKIKLTLHLLAQVLIKNDTHFKVIIFQEYNEKTVADWLVILDRLKIIGACFSVATGNNNSVKTDRGWVNFWGNKLNSFNSLAYYRHTPDRLLKLPDTVIDVPAGVPSPNSVNFYNISLVKAEILCLKKGYLDTSDFTMLEISRTKFPTKYFEYDKISGKWYLREENRPSKKYPIIYQELLNKL